MCICKVKRLSPISLNAVISHISLSFNQKTYVLIYPKLALSRIWSTSTANLQ